MAVKRIFIHNSNQRHMKFSSFRPSRLHSLALQHNKHCLNSVQATQICFTLNKLFCRCSLAQIFHFSVCFCVWVSACIHPRRCHSSLWWEGEIKSNLWRATWWSSAAFANNTISCVKWIFARKIIVHHFFRLLIHILYLWNCEGLLLSTVTVTNIIIVHVYLCTRTKAKCRLLEGCKWKRFPYTETANTNKQPE